MRSIGLLLVFAQLLVCVSGLRLSHDHEQKCKEEFLPNFGVCLCEYDDELDRSGLTMHDLTSINCTNQWKSQDVAWSMLSGLSTHLTKVGYTQLEELIFVGNNIHELPANLVGRESMMYLERLDLSNNGIHTILGKTFHSMPILNELILDNNDWYVDTRSSRVFSSIFNIEVLSLNNAFTATDETSQHVTALSAVFDDSKLDYLKKLSLENNRLSHVSASVFQKLPSLETLSLANNNINSLKGLWNSTCIPSDFVDQTMLLDHKCPLKKMILSHNEITSVSADFIDQINNLTNLASIDFTNNPFTCDCNLSPFYDFLMTEKDKNSQRVLNVGSLKCTEPTHLSGRSIKDLSREDLVCERFMSPQAGGDKNVAGIVFAVLFTVLAVIMLIALFINRDAVKSSLPNKLATLKRYLPGSTAGYKKFEFKDEKVEPVGV